MSPRWRGLAADLGASSGRVLAGSYDGSTLSLEEVHRFPNQPRREQGHLRWDFEGLLSEVQAGFAKGAAAGRPASLGIDSWAIDYGLLDASGRLLEAPIHYRDSRSEGMMEWAFARAPKAEIFASTGIQFLPFNTLYQLAWEARQGGAKLERAARALLIPDLFHRFLAGSDLAERSNASTTQMLRAADGGWDTRLLGALGIPSRLLPPLCAPGTRLGCLLPEAAEATGCAGAQLVAVATHDTASAVAAVPARSEGFAYLCSGTWSLIGAEMPAPVLSPRALDLNFTNEAGVFGTTRLLKNCMGLWLLQETARQWESEGRGMDWEAMQAAAAKAPPFACLVDPDDPSFLEPGDMPARILAYARRSGQAPPQDQGALLRCLFESLALKYRLVLQWLEELAGRPITALHAVGGGIHNRLLCQWTADCCGLPLLAGPAEASASGNLLVQLMAMGELKGLAEMRALIARSFSPREYLPAPASGWDAAYGRFQRMLMEQSQC